MLHSGNLAGAETELREARKTYVELGDETFAARAKLGLSHVALSRGNHSRAEALARGALATFASTKEHQGIAEALVTIAALKAADGDKQSAAELHGAAAAVRDTIAARPTPFDDAIPNHLLEKAREEADSAWEAAWSKGRGLSLEAAVEKALGQSRSGIGKA
jgi:hypothetical protein